MKHRVFFKFIFIFAHNLVMRLYNSPSDASFASTHANGTWWLFLQNSCFRRGETSSFEENLGSERTQRTRQHKNNLPGETLYECWHSLCSSNAAYLREIECEGSLEPPVESLLFSTHIRLCLRRKTFRRAKLICRMANPLPYFSKRTDLLDCSYIFPVQKSIGSF